MLFLAYQTFRVTFNEQLNVSSHFSVMILYSWTFPCTQCHASYQLTARVRAELDETAICSISQLSPTILHRDWEVK